jgi:WD40 repeat protein/serine/threonine protein kinase
MNPRLPSSSDELQQEIFLGALDRLDPGERTAFLDASCGTDSQLRHAVEDLLRETASLGDFLESPVLTSVEKSGSSEDDLTRPATQVIEQPGQCVGKYKLMHKLGEGGCGVVYLAEQEEPLRREVALKVIKLGMDTRQVMTRFEAERQTLALMDHSNIARVFDAGATEAGRPFFVMELVRGIKLTDYCDEKRLTIEERLRLFIQVCYAIQHAHQKGIIHRDIKPSNILVTSQDGKPIPKVIDFGIAKATDQQRLASQTLFTGLDQLIGTPAYMSPEQLELSHCDIDTRSDIYSLGVLLYELLTARTPADDDGLANRDLAEWRRIIQARDPVHPSIHLAKLPADELARIARHRRTTIARLIRLVQGDLDCIVMKALARHPMRRYATVAAFAQDLEYYLSTEPVLARPPSTFYRVGKLMRRRRAAFAAVLGIGVTLLIGTAASLWQAIRATQAETTARLAERSEVQLRRQAEHEQEQAKAQAALAKLNEYVADIGLAQQSLAGGDYGRAVHLLKKHQPQPGEADLRGFEWGYLARLSQGDQHTALPNQGHAVRWISFSPTGDVIAVGLDDELRLWNTGTHTLIRTISQPVVSALFAGEGHLVLSTPREVQVFDTTTWGAKTLPGHNGGAIAVSRDGAVLATASREGVRLWNTTNWSELSLLRGAFPPLAFSPDGKWLGTSGPRGITIWDLSTMNVVTVLSASENHFHRNPRVRFGQAMTFSADGLSIFAPGNWPSDPGLFTLDGWDFRTGEKLPRSESKLEQHTGFICWLAGSSENGVLATASMDHSIRLWDSQGHQSFAALHGHLSEVWTLAFSPDGRTLASGAKDGSVNLWTIPQPPKQDLLRGPYSPLAFARDGRHLAVLDYERHFVRLVDVTTRETEREFQLEPASFGPFSVISFSSEFRMLAEGLEDGSVRLRDTTTGETALLKASSTPVRELALSPDGQQLIAGGSNQPLRWWDLRTKTNSVLAAATHRVLFSPDGGILAVFVNPERIELWNVPTRALRTVLVPDSPSGPAATFSPDGRLLAIASDPLEPEQSIQFWETIHGKPVGACIGHKQGILSLAFSADGKTLASGSHDNTIKLWNTATRQELLSIPHPGAGFGSLLFSPDGQLLVATQAGQERELRFFSARASEEMTQATTSSGTRTD